MRGIARLLPLLLVFVPRAHAGVEVREAQGRVDVAATAAPLFEVLDRLARQTGMKIVYEGPAPRQLVTLSLAGRSPAEAVASILEGQGLNYALVLDVTATRVDKLLVTGSSTGGRALSGSSAPSPARLQPVRPPPVDEAEDEPDEEDEVVLPAGVPGAPGAPGPPATGANPPTDKGQPQPVPAPGTPVPTPAPPLVPLIPNTTYSSSPFNPRPLPMVPAPQPAPTPTPTPATTPP